MMRGNNYKFSLQVAPKHEQVHRAAVLFSQTIVYNSKKLAKSKLTQDSRGSQKVNENLLE